MCVDWGGGGGRKSGASVWSKYKGGRGPFGSATEGFCSHIRTMISVRLVYHSDFLVICKVKSHISFRQEKLSGVERLLIRTSQGRS